MGLNKRLIDQAGGGIVATDNFNVGLYDGNCTSQSINAGFAADFVLIKNRTVAQGWSSWDTVIGASNGYLQTQLTNALAPAQNMLTFDSEGFNVSTNGGAYTQTNRCSSSDKYVYYAFKAGGSAVSNTNGTITSQVSANPDAGFSIVKYTGNGSTATVGHGLSSTVELLIVKGLETTNDWSVLHKDLTNGNFLQLNLYAIQSGSGSIFGSPTARPTSTVFTIGNTGESGTVNKDYIAYCFHSVDGYQKVGSFQGTSAVGNKITTGFQPRFLMIKTYIGYIEYWYIFDAARNTSNPRNKHLKADQADSENTGYDINFDSDGFTINTAYSFNHSNNTCIYLAIA